MHLVAQLHPALSRTQTGGAAAHQHPASAAPLPSRRPADHRRSLASRRPPRCRRRPPDPGGRTLATRPTQPCQHPAGTAQSYGIPPRGGGPASACFRYITAASPPTRHPGSTPYASVLTNHTRPRRSVPRPKKKSAPREQADRQRPGRRHREPPSSAQHTLRDPRPRARHGRTMIAISRTIPGRGLDRRAIATGLTTIAFMALPIVDGPSSHTDPGAVAHHGHASHLVGRLPATDPGRHRYPDLLAASRLRSPVPCAQPAGQRVHCNRCPPGRPAAPRVSTAITTRPPGQGAIISALWLSPHLCPSTRTRGDSDEIGSRSNRRGSPSRRCRGSASATPAPSASCRRPLAARRCRGWPDTQHPTRVRLRCSTR